MNFFNDYRNYDFLNNFKFSNQNICFKKLNKHL